MVFETETPAAAAYLDRLAATDAGRSYKQRARKLLALRPGHTVLDLGCGSGADLVPLSEAVAPNGNVIGLDNDPANLAKARERTTATPSGVELRPADIHTLPLDDDSADRARTDRVLQHVADPAGVLAEARRVLRPGGRLVMAEPDWYTLAIDHPDLTTAQAYTRHITDKVIRNPALGRQLPRLAAEAGFGVATVLPVTSVFRDVREADQVLGLWRTTQRAVDAGYLARGAADGWLQHLAGGPFFASVTLHITVATVPAMS